MDTFSFVSFARLPDKGDDAQATISFATFTSADSANGNRESRELYLPAVAFQAREKGANATVNFVNFRIVFHPCDGRIKRPAFRAAAPGNRRRRAARHPHRRAPRRCRARG